jgi:hypothetical protein
MADHVEWVPCLWQWGDMSWSLNWELHVDGIAVGEVYHIESGSSLCSVDTYNEVVWSISSLRECARKLLCALQLEANGAEQ